MNKDKSILFVRPDYHCSFFYRDEFRGQGWKADIYVNRGYPSALLYSSEDILRSPQLFKGRNLLAKIINHGALILYWLSKFKRYRYHLYYGRPPAISFFEGKLGLDRIFGKGFLLELALAKFFGVKLIFLSTGCHDDESKEQFSKLDGGKVCGNCGAWDKCHDILNNQNFDRVRRYFDMVIGAGAIDSTQFKMTHMKYKSIDLKLWKPELAIPSEHRLPATSNLRIMHSAYLEKSGRNWKGKNIKGSPFVAAAVERLQSEGYPVEYFFVKDTPSNQMRFYQAQADIVVEQIIYGWWGSTFVETAALGKPVVCYLRPSWKDFFLTTFPEYGELPVVEATTDTVYEVLKRLVTDETYRMQKGKESRRFAEQHFDPVRNTQSLIKLLEAL